MWSKDNGPRAFYRGLPLGLIGIFPFSAFDLFIFEFQKRTYINAQRAKGYSEDSSQPGSMTVMTFGAISGSIGASLVYPINLARFLTFLFYGLLIPC
jgi:solute carrier family 25 phosphate transporter 23/24/25/41